MASRRPWAVLPLASVQSRGRDWPVRSSWLSLARRQGKKPLLWQLTGSQSLGSTSVRLHHGTSGPWSQGGAMGVCLSASQGLGAAGPDAGSLLFLHLSGTEGAVGECAAGVSCCCCYCCCRRGMVLHWPHRGTQLLSWKSCPCGCWLLSGLRLTQLPAHPFCHCTGPREPKAAKHQSPGHAVELPPCSVCLLRALCLSAAFRTESQKHGCSRSCIASLLRSGGR